MGTQAQGQKERERARCFCICYCSLSSHWRGDIVLQLSLAYRLAEPVTIVHCKSQKLLRFQQCLTRLGCHPKALVSLLATFLHGWRPPILLGPPVFRCQRNSHPRSLLQLLLQNPSITHTSSPEERVIFSHPHLHPSRILVPSHLAPDTSLLPHHWMKVLSKCSREILEARPWRKGAPVWMQRSTP